MRRMSEAPKPDAATVERFRAVVLPHLDAAYGFARWLARDPVLAQDLAQEAMLRALALLPCLPRRGGAALAAAHRAQHLERPPPAPRRHGSAPLDEIEDRPSDGPDPEQSALAGDRRRQIASALAALPADAREILVLREIEDLSYKHIASVLDLPVGTVMSRLARAREKLSAELLGRLGRRGHGLSDL